MCVLTSLLSGVSGRAMSSSGLGPAGRTSGQLVEFGAWVWIEAYAVIGEVGGLDDPRPRAGVEAGHDMLVVLVVLVTPRLVVRVRHRRDQL